jgi:hypothetical protein
VVEAREAPAGYALDLLHAVVEAFGRSIGGARAVVVHDLLPPTLQGVTEPADLSYLVGPTDRDGLVEELGGLYWIDGEVDVAHRLIGEPFAQELVVRVAKAQTEQHPVVPTLIEPIGTCQQQLADPAGRFVLPATVAQGIVLHAADLADTAVPDTHHVERVGHPDRTVEVRRGAGPIAPGQIGGLHADACEPDGILAGGLGSRSDGEHGTCGEVPDPSVHVLIAQSVSPLPHRRFNLTGRAGPPKQDKSPDLNPEAVLHLAADPKRPAPDDPARRLHYHRYFGRGLLRGQHPKAFQPQQCFANTGSVIQGRGFAFVGSSSNFHDVRTPAALADRSLRHAHQFNIESSTLRAGIAQRHLHALHFGTFPKPPQESRST